MPRTFENPPAFIAPQAPTLTAEPPTEAGWIHEIKHDGYRTLLRLERRSFQAFSRNGYDWSSKYRPVLDACRGLHCQLAMIDGEMIVQDAKGISDFAALRGAIEDEPHRLVFYAFDLLFLDGHDLRQVPLIERRGKLAELIPTDPKSHIQFSEHLEGDGASIFRWACSMGLEGIVSKRVLGRYRSGPSKEWLKTKNVVESDFILLGTDCDKDGKPIAYLGREEEGRLQFAGRAFLLPTSSSRESLHAKAAKLASTKPPVRLPGARKAMWLKPELRVKVRHLAGGDHLRHGIVRGLADD